MSRFHNPYHFVPVKPRSEADKQQDLTLEKDRSVKWGSHSHESYGKGLNSGRLVCRLTTETPIFIGGKQHDKTEPKQIEHFMLNGQPAIPASSLRGLLSSIAEAASNSALRVLHRDRILSYRYTMKQNLSALGIVILKKDEDGSTNYFLKPLIMPSLEKKGGGYCYPDTFANRKTEYAPMYRHFGKPPLKVFINGCGLTTYRHESPEYYYLRLDPSISFNASKTGINNHDALRFSSNDQSDKKTAIGQQSNQGSVSRPIAEADWKRLPETERKQYTRGIIRVMWSHSRKADMPSGKKHELFIPFPVETEKDSTHFPLPGSVVKHFHDICDQRSEENEMHPYEPVGTRPGRNGDKLRLKHGDIVYFAPNATGTEVAEVSFSSIWRGVAGRLEEYFSKVDTELLPFNSNRSRITPAELIFGFVQDEKGDASLAFKGKVRISNGLLEEGQDEPFTKEVTLKILSSPKPPSPAMYFKPANNPQGGYIAKADLKPGTHYPQGRKFYLHHKVAEDQTPWKTDYEKELLNQKNRIRPLRKGLSFSFTIQFDNLTDWELGLLCYAVRPDDGFRHKIGMGKPLGLGSVRIDPETLEIVDRSKRYSPEGFTAVRHAPASFDKYRATFTKGMDTQIANALKVLGDPAKVKLPVHTPQVVGIGLEEETFRWFVANDVGFGSENKGNKIKPVNCCLKPITKDDLPELERMPFAHDGTPHSGGGKQRDNHKHSAGQNKPGPGNKSHQGNDKKPENKGGEKFSNNAFASLEKWKK